MGGGGAKTNLYRALFTTHERMQAPSMTASKLLATTVGGHRNTRPLEITRQKNSESNRRNRHANAHDPNHRPSSGGSHRSSCFARSPEKRAPLEPEHVEEGGERLRYTSRSDGLNELGTSHAFGSVMNIKRDEETHLVANCFPVSRL